jgi:hypothetical protein
MPTQPYKFCDENTLMDFKVFPVIINDTYFALNGTWTFLQDIDAPWKTVIFVEKCNLMSI